MKLQVTGYRGYIITNEARVAQEGIKISSILSVIKRIKNKAINAEAIERLSEPAIQASSS